MFTVGQTAEYLFRSNREMTKDPKITVEEKKKLTWENFVHDIYKSDYSVSYLGKLRVMFRKLSPYPLFQNLQVSGTKILKYTEVCNSKDPACVRIVFQATQRFRVPWLPSCVRYFLLVKLHF